MFEFKVCITSLIIIYFVLERSVVDTFTKSISRNEISMKMYAFGPIKLLKKLSSGEVSYRKIRVFV